MKLKELIDNLDIFQGIILIDSKTKEPITKHHEDLFHLKKYYENEIYKIYTHINGEDIAIEIDTF